MVFSSSPAVTVSIVTYHTDLLKLTATIDSLGQSSVPLDVLIVDNSQDEAYFAQLSRIPCVRFIRSPRNGGYGFGHNFAVAATISAAPYHLIINPDVVVHPGCLEALIEVFAAQREVVLAMPLILNPDGSVQHLNKRNPTVLDLMLRRFTPRCIQRLPIVRRRMDRYIRMDSGYELPSEIPYASGCFMLFRRRGLDELRGFDERFFMYFEDADITRRAALLGRVLFVPEASITHHWTRGSHTSRRLMICTIISACRYFRKWGWKLW